MIEKRLVETSPWGLEGVGRDGLHQNGRPSVAHIMLRSLPGVADCSHSRSFQRRRPDTLRFRLRRPTMIRIQGTSSAVFAAPSRPQVLRLQGKGEGRLIAAARLAGLKPAPQAPTRGRPNWHPEWH
jgi:hypothetical protein